MRFDACAAVLKIESSMSSKQIIGAIFAAPIVKIFDELPGVKSWTEAAKSEIFDAIERNGMYSPKGVRCCFT